MNFGAINTAINGGIDYGSFSDTTQITNWINKAYGIVWAGGDWPFKISAPTDLALTSGTRTVTSPAGMAKPVYISSHVDDWIDWLAPKDFYATYGLTNSTSTGVPQNYTIVDSTIMVAPTPNSAYTFRIVYEREPAVKTSGGAFKDGVYDGSSTTDVPAWDEAFHYMLVHGAMATGLGFIGSEDAAWHNDEFTKMLQQMIQFYSPFQRAGSNPQMYRDSLT